MLYEQRVACVDKLRELKQGFALPGASKSAAEFILGALQQRSTGSQSAAA